MQLLVFTLFFFSSFCLQLPCLLLPLLLPLTDQTCPLCRPCGYAASSPIWAAWPCLQFQGKLLEYSRLFFFPLFFSKCVSWLAYKCSTFCLFREILLSTEESPLLPLEYLLFTPQQHLSLCLPSCVSGKKEQNTTGECVTTWSKSA